MKKTIIPIAILLCSAWHTQGQTLGELLNKASQIASENGILKTSQTGSPNTKSPTSLDFMNNAEISNGLKEALKLGAKSATNQLSVTNGFFGNQLVKILMPPEVRAIESKMRQFGMGKVVDQAIMTMNRAAEDASSRALPILVNTITSFNINDAASILKGGENAATNILKAKAGDQIAAAFRPVIDQSMRKFNVNGAWQKVFSTYNSLPIIKNKVNTDLTGYVTGKALDGLFTIIGQEERKIRLDPVGTGSDIIGRVFGALKK